MQTRDKLRRPKWISEQEWLAWMVSEVRLRHGYSVAYVAWSVGLDRTAVSHLLGGRCHIGPAGRERLRRWCRKLLV